MKKTGTTIAASIGIAIIAAMPLLAHSQAATRGVYVGVGAGQSEAVNYTDRMCDPNLVTSATNCKKIGSTYRFFGGWQFGRNWGLEFGYSDLGKVTANTPGALDQSLKVRLSELTLLASLPLTERFALYGKAGAYYGTSSTDTTQNGVSQRLSESRSNITFAGGIQWYMTSHFALRGEGQHYMKVGTAVGDLDYNVYTVGLLYKLQ